ncbi:hypothetical protein CQ020_14240 [Arthrobacter sp. MYb23]|nr:hypothetical protein CQ038_14755 [Arthrobacter sp. MYb51]PRB94727.1 hypothetical protein CQ020_14240 [Arthrobacter sp. MYb23]
MLRIAGQPGTDRSRRSRFTAGTGSHCPISGIWAPEGDIEKSMRLLEGNIMPARGDSAVDWQLLQGLTRHDLHS